MSARRIAVALEYDGTDFIGWQRQSAGRSVQAVLECALGVVADEPVATVCAGRTDRGVHAAAQIAHFDTTRMRSARAWVLGANSNLPPDVSLLWARAVPDEFHARFSALARCYRYLLCERPTRPALARRRAAWSRHRLDLERMREATTCLLGEHDFSAFRGSDCQARSPVRTVRRVTIAREEGRVCVEIEANAFLHHMVRNLVGSLIVIGRGDAQPQWLAEVLHGRDRRRAGPTAPACGLSLIGVDYPAHFGLYASADATPDRDGTGEPLGYDDR